MRKSFISCCVAVASGAVSFSVPTYAADIALEEIIVTSQRRAEKLQDIPVAVTSVDADQLEFKQIENVQDIQLLVPNLSMATNTGLSNGARIFMRGIGEDDSRFTVDPAVSMYVDGVYIGRQVGSMFDLLDLERVEVLRGPQGTLYGRNSNGGAISLVSKKPGDENTIKGRLTIGNEGRQDMRFSGNVAATDKLSAQLAYLNKSRDGLFTTQTGKEVGEQDMEAMRFALSYQFDNGIDALFSYDEANDNSDPVPPSFPRHTEKALGYDGDEFTIENSLFTRGGNPDLLESSLDQHGTSLRLSGDWNDLTITSLTAQRSLENDLVSIINFPYTHDVEQDQFSQEFQFASNYTGVFNFVAGVFYFDESAKQPYTFSIPFVPLDYMLDQDTEALAVYGQLFYDINDDVRLTLGSRYTTEEKDFYGRISSTTFIPSLIPVYNRSVDDSQSWNHSDYRVALDWQAIDDVMLFASVTTGFKSGGWSPDNFVIVDEETVITYETGAKTQFWDNRARVNFTFFYNDYQDLQLNGTINGAFTRFNIDKAVTRGAELETQFAVTESLNVFANVGYLDAEYRDIKTPGIVPNVIPSTSTVMKNSPPWVVTVGGDYTWNLGEAGDLIAGLDVNYEDESYGVVNTDQADRFHTKRENLALVNTRLRWNSPEGHWSVTLWGKNLTDEHYYPAAGSPVFSSTGVLQQQGSVYVADPKTYGVDLAFGF